VGSGVASCIFHAIINHLRGTDRCVLLSTQMLVYGSCYDEADHTLAVRKAGRVALIDMNGDGRMAMNGDGRIARILEARIVNVFRDSRRMLRSRPYDVVVKLKRSAV
jgi:hypothetical protein